MGVEVIKHERNMGKGESLKDFVEKAKLLHPGVVVTMDADSQHDPADIPRVVRPILEGEADIVVGVRDMATGAAPRHRVLGNKMLDIVTNAKAGAPLRDTQSGFRAYFSRALDTLDFTEKGMAVESQTLVDAAKAGLKIVGVSVSTTYNALGRREARLGMGQECLITC